MKKKKAVRRLSYLFFVALFVISAVPLGQDLTEYYRVKEKYKTIEKKVKKDREIDWEKLLEINPDTVAWIELPDTPVDYPVVRAVSNREYLNKDVNGKQSIYGAVFLDERLYKTDLTQNPNNIIYGHNMGRWTDVMFSSLKEYLNSTYLKGHETVILYTQTGTYYYEIASVSYDTNAPDMYEIDFKDTNFSSWVKQQTSLSLYPCISEKKIENYTDNFRGRGDHLLRDITEYGNTLTLSTCDTTHSNYRKICILCIPKQKN